MKETLPTATTTLSAAPRDSASTTHTGDQHGGSGLSEPRRRELADFLRTRREKLKPEQVGISQGSRRRTPGLRREEVAELAGVGTTWYTWLEQARDIQPSSDVLRRLGQALKLNDAEIKHLFSLAGKAAPVDSDAVTETVSEGLKRVLDGALQVPAVLVGARWDVLEMNDKAKEMFATLRELQQLPKEKRNWLYFIFCTPGPRATLENWEETARRVLAEFRASVSDSLDNPWIAEMVDLLKKESTEFDGWWREHEVRDQGSATVGIIEDQDRYALERTILRPAENPRYRIILLMRNH